MLQKVSEKARHRCYIRRVREQVISFSMEKKRACAGALIALAGFLLCAPGRAQSEVQKPKPDRTFSVAAWKEAIAGPVRFEDGESGVMPVIPWMHRGGPYELKKDEIILFEGDAPLPAADDKSRLQLASAKIGPGITQPLLLLVPAQKEAGKKFEIVVLDDDIGHFPFGSYRFQNLADAPIEGSVDGHDFHVPPGGVSVIQLQRDKPQDVVVKATMNKNGKTVPIMETIWTFEPRLRKHIIFGRSGDGKNIEPRSILEYEKRK